MLAKGMEDARIQQVVWGGIEANGPTDVAEAPSVDFTGPGKVGPGAFFFLSINVPGSAGKEELAFMYE